MGDVKQLSIPVAYDRGVSGVAPLRGQATLQVGSDLLRRLAASQHAITDLDLYSVTVGLIPAGEYVQLSAQSGGYDAPRDGASRRPQQAAFAAGLVLDRQGEISLTCRTWNFDLGWFTSHPVTELAELVSAYKREHAAMPRA